MRRAPIVLGATAAGLAAVLSFHTKSAPLSIGTTTGASIRAGTATSVAAGSPPGSTGTSGTKKSDHAATTPTTRPPTTSTSTARSTNSSAVPSTSTPSTVPATTPSTTKSKTPAAETATRTAVGTTVNYTYGTLSVSVTASGSKITHVTLASLDDGGNFRSQSIDEQSIPILEQEALEAQSAHIESVSGASYTSAGFAQSLQAALSKLGL